MYCAVQRCSIVLLIFPGKKNYSVTIQMEAVEYYSSDYFL